MYKIRITGLNTPKAKVGLQTGPGPLGALGPILASPILKWATKKPSTGDAVASVLDPTGLANVPFVNEAVGNFIQAPSLKTGANLGWNLLGQIPVFGEAFRTPKAVATVNKIEKVSKPITKGETIAKAITPVMKPIAKGGKKIIKGAVNTVTAPARAVDKSWRFLGIEPLIGNGIMHSNIFNRGERGWGALPETVDKIEEIMPSESSWQISPKYAFGGPHSEIPSLFSTQPDRLYKAIAGGEGYYQVGGVRQNCGEGYKWDDLSKQCIVDPNYSVQGKSKGLVNTPAPGFSKDYQTMTMVPSMSTDGMQTFDWTTGSTDIQGNPTAAPAPVNPNQETLYKLDSNQTGPTIGLFNQKKTKSKSTRAGLVNAANKFDIWSRMLTGVGQTYSDIINANQAQKEFNRTFAESRDPFFRYANVQDPEGSRGFFQTNTGKNPEAGFKTVGADGGTMLTNTDMNRVKIKITGGPNAKMAYGGQSGYGFDLGQRNTYAAMPKGKIQTVSDTIQEVPREEANIEAEKGETIYADVDGDGVSEHMNIEGKRHVDGGTPLSVPEGSFVFSDTKKMTIKDEAVLARFGMAPRKQGYTPAEIAKKYDINKYKAIIEDENSDSVMKNTAQLMVKNYQKKLAELALVQEQMKGFPQGIPQMCYGVLPDEMLQAIQAQIDEAKGQSGMMSPEQEQQAAQMMGPGEEDNGIQEPNEGTPQEQMSPDEEYPEGMYGGDFEYGGSPNAYFDESDVNEYAMGGPGPDDPITWQTPELKKQIEAAGKTQWSQRAQAGDISLPSMQNKQSSGLYGDIGLTDVNDLKSRNKWYFDKNPNWDSSNPADVLDFQTKYDEEFAKQHGYQYFSGTANHNKKDGKLGEYTYNAPGLEVAPAQTDETVFGYKCTGRDANNNPMVGPAITYKDKAARDADGAVASMQEAYKQCPQNSTTTSGNLDENFKSKVPFAYMTPDLWKMGAAFGMKGRKFLPYIADTSFEPNKFQKEDWYSKASQLESLNRQAGEQIGAFKSGQASAADISNLAANQAENLIGAIADVDARNVRGVNAFNQAEQDRKDKFNLLRSANATERARGNAVANQAWDNFINKKMSNIVDTASNAWENRMKLGLVNETNKFYYTDPRTGRTVFKGGYGPENIGQTSSTGWNGVSSDYQKAKSAMAANGIDLTFDQYLKTIGKTDTQTNKFGGRVNKKNKTTLTDVANMLSKGYSFPF